MPHAASGQLQRYRMSNPKVVGFNAARGKWSVATSKDEACINVGIKGFNAARGKWSVATGSFTFTTWEKLVSMPHAAGGRLQLQMVTQ